MVPPVPDGVKHRCAHGTTQPGKGFPRQRSTHATCTMGHPCAVSPKLGRRLLLAMLFLHSLEQISHIIHLAGFSESSTPSRLFSCLTRLPTDGFLSRIEAIPMFQFLARKTPFIQASISLSHSTAIPRAKTRNAFRSRSLWCSS